MSYHCTANYLGPKQKQQTKELLDKVKWLKEYKVTFLRKLSLNVNWTMTGFIRNSLALRIIFLYWNIWQRKVSIFPVYLEAISAYLQWQSCPKNSLSGQRLVPVILILSPATVTVCGVALPPVRLPEESQH